MASRISNEELVNKVKRFLVGDMSKEGLDTLIQEAIIATDQDIRNADEFSPLAWDIAYYDGIRTCYPAEIQSITQASPGVFAASSVSSDLSGHGFHDHASLRDIVAIVRVEGMKELNFRVCLLEYIDTDSFSLKSIDGLSNIDTTNFNAYVSGGYVYHLGVVLNTETILTGVDDQWGFKQPIHCPTFDGEKTQPITEKEIRDNRNWITSYQRPQRYRFWRNITNPHTPTESHYLFWYPASDQIYNVHLPYQKEIPDISDWDTSHYPYHPPEVHPVLWHGALANLGGSSKRMERQTDKQITTQMEVMFLRKWIGDFEKDKRRIINLSRKMLGGGSSEGFSA